MDGMLSQDEINALLNGMDLDNPDLLGGDDGGADSASSERLRLIRACFRTSKRMP